MKIMTCQISQLPVINLFMAYVIRLRPRPTMLIHPGRIKYMNITR